MTASQSEHYNQVAEAITYIRQNYTRQPSLQDIASKVYLSPQYFQKVFTEWAGISPKKFLQYISIENAKKMLVQEGATLLDTAVDMGLSGTGRLHDLFISIEGMTPGEYKNKGANLQINYSYAESPFGHIIVASTPKGICHMAFFENRESAFLELKSRFPNAQYRLMVDSMQQNALFIFSQEWHKIPEIKLHLKGTKFQLKVWETLLKIPLGKLAAYGSIARAVDNPDASRAVGTAVKSNPVAYLIPCHRVIKADGNLGGYMWGETRKTAMVGWEAAKQN